MPRPYSHPDIQIHYQTLINRGFECVCEHSIPRAYITKYNIEFLLRILTLKEKTDELTTMKINLIRMNESLSWLLAMPRII